jgi:hypothetical protein
VSRGTIPDQRLWGQVQIPGPFDRSVSDSSTSKFGVVRPQAFEHGAPQKIADLTLDRRPVGQGQPKPVVLKRFDRLDPEHRSAILRKRCDPDDRLAGRGSPPILDQFVLMLGRPFDDEAEGAPALILTTDPDDLSLLLDGEPEATRVALVRV